MNTDMLEERLNAFHNLIEGGDYKSALELCEQTISDAQHQLKAREDNTVENNNQWYVIGITFKGFAEFIDLYNATKIPNWKEAPKKVELVWELLCDSTDHLNFSAGVMQSKPLDNILKRLKAFSELFTKLFGKGMYISPVIILKKESCSICSEDIKSCNHRQGQLYNGIICRSVAEIISDFRSVDIVTIPKDPRCRIWPWNKTGSRTYTARIMDMNTIDGFLYA